MNNRIHLVIITLGLIITAPTTPQDVAQPMMSFGTPKVCPCIAVDATNPNDPGMIAIRDIAQTVPSGKIFRYTPSDTKTCFIYLPSLQGIASDSKAIKGWTDQSLPGLLPLKVYEANAVNNQNQYTIYTKSPLEFTNVSTVEDVKSTLNIIVNE